MNRRRRQSCRCPAAVAAWKGETAKSAKARSVLCLLCLWSSAPLLVPVSRWVAGKSPRSSPVERESLFSADRIWCCLSAAAINPYRLDSMAAGPVRCAVHAIGKCGRCVSLVEGRRREEGPFPLSVNCKGFARHDAAMGPPAPKAGESWGRRRPDRGQGGVPRLPCVRPSITLPYRTESQGEHRDEQKPNAGKRTDRQPSSSLCIIGTAVSFFGLANVALLSLTQIFAPQL